MRRRRIPCWTDACTTASLTSWRLAWQSTICYCRNRNCWNSRPGAKSSFRSRSTLSRSRKSRSIGAGQGYQSNTQSFEENNNVQVKVLINVETDSNQIQELYKSELFEKQLESTKQLMDPVQDTQLELNSGPELKVEKLLQNFECDDLNNSGFN